MDLRRPPLSAHTAGPSTSSQVSQRTPNTATRPPPSPFLSTPTQMVAVQASTDPISALRALEDELRRSVEAARQRLSAEEAESSIRGGVSGATEEGELLPPLPEERDGVPSRIAALRERRISGSGYE